MELTAADTRTHAGFSNDGRPLFWIGDAAAPPSAVPTAFTAPTSRLLSRRSWCGCQDHGAPGPRPDYHANYPVLMPPSSLIPSLPRERDRRCSAESASTTTRSRARRSDTWTRSGYSEPHSRLGRATTTVATYPGSYNQPVDSSRTTQASAMRTGDGGVALVRDFKASGRVLAFICQKPLEHAPARVEHGFGHPRFDELQTTHVTDDDSLIPIYDFS
jgi:hypothetical protein